jgi:predicted histone-like DNA-binding protein
MVFYKLYQENNPKSVNVGKWYARAVAIQTIDTEGLIAEIEKLCTATDADVVAVMRALVFVMNKKLQDGYRVKLNGLGSFKIGLKTKAAESAKEFTATKHIVGSRVNFRPETHWSAADGNKRHKVFLDNLHVQELKPYSVDKSGEDDNENTGD